MKKVFPMESTQYLGLNIYIILQLLLQWLIPQKANSKASPIAGQSKASITCQQNIIFYLDKKLNDSVVRTLYNIARVSSGNFMRTGVLLWCCTRSGLV